ncbi:MAG TPA: hypothetical protein VGO67_15105 [Verrucomicrobiae bacterium]|jgi:integrase
MDAPNAKMSGTANEVAKPEKKVIKVQFHGHVWPIYPMKSRGKDIYRVFHRVNGERKPKTFMSLSEAKKDAKNILKELYGRGESKIHLTEAQKRDWHAATGVLKDAGIRSSLETVTRHYSDLIKVIGHASLLTDVTRKYAESRGKSGAPIKLADLRVDYLAALKKQERSRRYIDAQKSHTGQFTRDAGEVMSDRVTRELIQNFIDAKRDVDARTKKNLLDAVRAMMAFGKSNRNVPQEWDESDRVVMPAVKPKKVKTYSAEDLKKLFAAAPQRFKPILALAAFGGIRSSEIELLDWKHIRLFEEDARDNIIKLDVDVTDEASKRTVPVDNPLEDWLIGPAKSEGKVWKGKHDEFYAMQQKIAKKAGVKWQQNALRHTCISAKVALTKNVPQVAYESGNSVAVIKKHYLDLMTPSMAKAWFATTRLAVYNYEKENEKKSPSRF